MHILIKCVQFYFRDIYFQFLFLTFNSRKLYLCALQTDIKRIRSLVWIQ